MPLRFPRLTGAGGDAVELQYVAALLQTTSDKSWRSDGTVTALDIRRYLTSRHGFRVDTDILEREILGHLVGTRIPPKEEPSEDPLTPVAENSDEENSDEETTQVRSSRQLEKEQREQQQRRKKKKKDGEKKKKKKFNARKVRYHGGHMHVQPTEPVMDIVQLTALVVTPELVRLHRAAESQKTQEQAMQAASSFDEEVQSPDSSWRRATNRPGGSTPRNFPVTNDVDRTKRTAAPDESAGSPMALIEFVLEVLREEVAFITPEDELTADNGTGDDPIVLTVEDIAKLDLEHDYGEDGDQMFAASPKKRNSGWLMAAHKHPIRLSRRVLIRLLRAVGEDPAHWTNEDLDEMLQLAHDPDGPPLLADSDFELDAAALLRAVTSDVANYPVDRLDALSTHYHDVMGTVVAVDHDDDDTDVVIQGPDPAGLADMMAASTGTHNSAPTVRGVDGTISVEGAPAVTMELTHDSVLSTDEERGQQPGHSASSDHPEHSKLLATMSSGSLTHDTAGIVGKAAVQAIKEVTTQTHQLQKKLRPPLTLGTSHERIFTLASLDQAADTQRSLVWTCLSWLTLVATFFAYFIGSVDERFDYQTNLPSLNCTAVDSYDFSEFGCKSLNGIVRWSQVFLELSILGTAFMILSQLGNNVYALEHQSRWVTTLSSLVGIGTVLCASVLSYFYELDTNFFNTEGPRAAAHVVAVGIGTILVIQQIIELVRLYLPMERYPNLKKYFVSGCLKREQSTKSSACFKTGRMLTNAVGCYLGDGFDQRREDEVDDDEDSPREMGVDGISVNEREVFLDAQAPLMERVSSLVSAIDRRRSADEATGIVGGGGGLQARAVMYYHTHIDETEMTGSMRYFWCNLFSSRSLVREEGLWLSNRLIAANLAQWIVAALVVPALFFVFYVLNDDDSEVEKRQAENNINEIEVVAGIFFGGVAALLVSWLIALIYIPMAMSTTLQLRSGYLGNFFDQRFQLFRKSPDRATALFGSALWGSLFSVALAWGIVGGLVFVLLWKDIRDEVLDFLTTVIGFTVTFSLKWLMLKVFRRFWFSALYRRKPGAANIMHLVLECWNLGLSSGFMLIRIVRLVLTSLFYVGRMDTPLLAEGVGVIFNSPLDSYPMAFRRDLIIHEAHRHPWIERLGTMYMMKLQHGHNFGSRGGAAWRTVLVLALFPWLRKHRQLPPIILDDSEDSGNADDMYGLGSLSGIRNRRRKAVVISHQIHDPTTQLMVENQSLLFENHSLQRQVMELQSRLGHERRRTTVLNKTLRTSFRASIVPSPTSNASLQYNDANEHRRRRDTSET